MFSNITMNAELSKDEILTTAGKFFSMVEDFDPDLIEFVKGQPEGAGMNFRETFYLRCAYEMLLNYGQLSSMCASFAATGSATENGKSIIGRNIDFSGDWPFKLLKIRHIDGMEQLALCTGVTTALVSKTLASVIMVPEDRKMFIAYGNPCRSDYVEFGI